MSYSSMSEMATSASLTRRLIACAAAESVASPDIWVTQRLWQFAAMPGWADKWDYAKDTYTPDANPDHGARPGVISDADILTAVQAVKALP